MGKHGSNVDTMIFTHIDSSARKITLVSLPRDLYVNGRKLNSVYADYGIREQVRWVEDLTGFRIQKYALIDMYVFRDVVDLMGGVDVVLEEDLIDPTYKTCDGGVCSTLFYEAGEHHLDGTQALRVARSRHTTSDYSRSERQQLILKAMQEKAKTLGFGDADKLLSMVTKVIAAVDTNITVDQAMLYYFRYQNFDLEGGNVISTGNVLENVPVPVDYVTSRVVTTCLDETKPETCKEGYALDTLSPRGGDWDLIKWYIRSLF